MYDANSNGGRIASDERPMGCIDETLQPLRTVAAEEKHVSLLPDAEERLILP